MDRLTDKTALITGAARGLGAQIAESFIAEGANVIINDLNITAAQATAERLGGQALACDVSDSASVARMFEELAELTDRLDILVNNAGISGIEGDNTAQLLGSVPTNNAPATSICNISQIPLMSGANGNHTSALAHSLSRIWLARRCSAL